MHVSDDALYLRFFTGVVLNLHGWRPDSDGRTVWYVSCWNSSNISVLYYVYAYNAGSCMRSSKYEL